MKTPQFSADFHVVWEEWSDQEREQQLQDGWVPQDLHRGESGWFNSGDWESQF